jgi:hypothetical protein
VLTTSFPAARITQRLRDLSQLEMLLTDYLTAGETGTSG